MIIFDVAKYIDLEGLGVYDETGASNSTIFIEGQPVGPDRCISIHHRGGAPGDTKYGYDRPTMQIIVRGDPDDLVGAMSLAHSIHGKLHGFHGAPFITGGAYIIDCRAVQSGPTHLGKDSNNRHEYSLNFTIEYVNKTKHRE